jgi:hypothetical protein
VIAISGLLVVLAFVTLIIGVFQSGLQWIYVSIAASVAAAVSLATGVVRSRPKAVAVTGPDPLGTWGGTATPVLDRPVDERSYEEVAPIGTMDDEEEEPTTQVLRLDEAEPEEAAPTEEPPVRATRTGSAARPRKTTARATASSATVVVVPGRDKFHKESCRYAKGQVTQTITKAAAKREGYSPCGVCKP